MLKRGTKGPVIDRNEEIRAAGVSTTGIKGEKAVPSCLINSHPEELAESLVRAEVCGRQREPKFCLPDAPYLPTNSLHELLTTELYRSRFTAFKEKFFEELYFKRAVVGQVKPANSKPDSVTNMSQTFGRPSSVTSAESLYSIIMPLKSREQVDAEYKDCHEQRIVSHNHYFPAEQINRKYSQHFDRQNPCGESKSIGDTGLKVKSCLTEGERRLKVVGKAQVDFMQRTVPPLGKKFRKYPYEVPNITFGASRRGNGDVKMVLHNNISSGKDDLLMAISHLNMIRLHLRKRQDIYIHSLLAYLHQMDPEETGLLPFDRLLAILHSFRIRLEAQKMRIVASHYRMIVDEGLPTEGVKYWEFCKLLSIQEPLPPIGDVETYTDASSLDTTYRLLCADRHKKSNEEPISQHQQVEKDMTGVKDLLAPEFDAFRDVEADDFTRLRPKVEIKQIFRNLVEKDEFEAIWQSLMAKYLCQVGVASVTQFHTEMHQK